MIRLLITNFIHSIFSYLIIVQALHAVGRSLCFRKEILFVFNHSYPVYLSEFGLLPLKFKLN